MTGAASIRDEFEKIKLQLIVKIADFVYKLTNDSTRRLILFVLFIMK